MIRAEITDASNPNIKRQGSFVREVADGPGWQDRLRKEIRIIHEDSPADRPFQVRLYRGNPVRVGDRTVLNFNTSEV